MSVYGAHYFVHNKSLCAWLWKALSIYFMHQISNMEQKILLHSSVSKTKRNGYSIRWTIMLQANRGGPMEGYVQSWKVLYYWVTVLIALLLVPVFYIIFLLSGLQEYDLYGPEMQSGYSTTHSISTTNMVPVKGRSWLSHYRQPWGLKCIFSRVVCFWSDGLIHGVEVHCNYMKHVSVMYDQELNPRTPFREEK